MHSQPTEHPEIFRAVTDEDVDGKKLISAIDELARLAAQGESEAILHMLDEVIPSASVRSSPPPDLTSIV